jgi:dihydrofolate reductase
MTAVFVALATSLDGYITGRDPGPGQGLGDGGVLFDWYGHPDNADYFEELSARVGAVVTGRTTYDDSESFSGGSPHATAPMVVVSHRAGPEAFADSPRQSFAGSIDEAIAAAREQAGEKDVAIQGGVTASEAIERGLVDEVIVHVVPVLLGGGRRFFHELPRHVALTVVDTVPGAGVTHLHYRVGAQHVEEGGS